MLLIADRERRRKANWKLHSNSMHSTLATLKVFSICLTPISFRSTLCRVLHEHLSYTAIRPCGHTGQAGQSLLWAMFTMAAQTFRHIWTTQRPWWNVSCLIPWANLSFSQDLWVVLTRAVQPYQARVGILRINSSRWKLDISMCLSYRDLHLSKGLYFH
jgi:hypothetical protein